MNWTCASGQRVGGGGSAGDTWGNRYGGTGIPGPPPGPDSGPLRSGPCGRGGPDRAAQAPRTAGNEGVDQPVRGKESWLRVGGPRRGGGGIDPTAPGRARADSGLSPPAALGVTPFHRQMEPDVD